MGNVTNCACARRKGVGITAEGDLLGDLKDECWVNREGSIIAYYMSPKKDALTSMLILDKDANTRATIRVHQGGCVVYEGSERDQESRVLCTVREWAGMFIVYSGRHDDNSTVQGRVIPNLDYSKFTVYEGESDTVLGLVPGYYEGGSQNKLCIDGWSGKILLWVGKISHSFFVGL